MTARRAFAVLASLVLAACGRSDPPPEFAGPPSPALFEVSAADGTVEGWLFGTIHALPDGVDWKTDRFTNAVKQADLLVVEVRDLENAAALREAFDARAYTEGLPPLADRMPAGIRRALRDQMAAHSVPANAFSNMETWAAALTLAQYAKRGDPANGVDRALLREMASAPVVELEGAAAQLAIFDTLPEAEQRDLLGAILADMADQRAEPVDLAANWYAGRIAYLADPATSAILADPELRAALYTGRNRAWAQRLEALFADAPRPFIAVGAAHLAGDDGLPALLTQRGYTVRRIQ
ncbi:TraB/GumN family protein [Pelagerythrobacter marensis]|uniref:TraB/GumN family protein n=1 Tax=Pelagerythrobacter marensis TaxID=543877 RepID=A0A0G3X8J5_9SPHN|nr:TraB/GumN family protein [Pelagerythrobacter marensis]AKM06939.1 hypothetical protein AM2010_861 [Pelagerythrobacter marensis]